MKMLPEARCGPAFDAPTSVVLLFLQATTERSANPISQPLCIPTPLLRCVTVIVLGRGWSG